MEEYSDNLEKNLEELEMEVETLNAMINELLRRVSKEKDKGLQTLPEVEKWISTAEESESKASSLLNESISECHDLSTHDDCSKISESTLQYSETVFMTLEEIKTLRSKGSFKVLVERAPLSHVKKMLLPLQPIVSREMLLEKAWKCLTENECGTLGLYGMGGVGKTTLLTQIKNKFIEVRYVSIGLVLFVAVESEEVEGIQVAIMKRLGLDWRQRSEREKASEIYEFLNKMRFVLLLDGVQREGLDLACIGVPEPSRGNGCKVVFTTPVQEACRSKCVDAIEEVKCLSPEEACCCFQEIVGEITLKSHPDIPQLARIISRKCGGLPIALSLIGETMSHKRNVREWHHAIHVLVSSAAVLTDVKYEIFPILKFSYDSLPGENIRSCFLYCALFPKTCDISKQDLVDCWIAEGMIEDEDREIAEIQGYEMMGDFVRTRLLMDNESGYGLKMHGMVRELALWIASDFGRQKENFVVVSGQRIHQMPEVDDWRIITRMSVTSTHIENISDSPDCSKLTTLFLQGNNNLKWISGDFFRWMTSLVVLNLSSNTELSELPEEVSSLVSLQFLNLSFTSIKRLPLGLQELKRLTHLDLDYTDLLREIEVIGSLLNLKVLRLFRSVPMDLSLMEDIQLLKSLEELSLTVREADVLKRLLSIHQLASCIRRLHLSWITDGGILLLNSMLSLRELDIGMCDIPEITIQRETLHYGNIPLLQNIRTVTLSWCKDIKDLTWLLFAPNLGDLKIHECQQIERIINKEKAVAADMSEQPFQNLTRLSLDSLPQLESIYWTPLPFPVLEYLYVTGCPKLTRLPFNSDSVEGNQVRSDLDQEWIKGVEWEDEATKELFSGFVDRNFPKMAEDQMMDGLASSSHQIELLSSREQHSHDRRGTIMTGELVSFGIQKLWDLLSHKHEQFQGVKDQVTELKAYLSTLKSFVKDADTKKHSKSVVKNFVEVIKKIIFDAEDTIETFILKDELGKDGGINKRIGRLVAQTVGSSLVDLMRSGDMPQREAALRALNSISSFEGSAKVLISIGIIPPLIKDLFYVGPNNLPIRLKEVSATILANVVNSGYDFDKTTLVSENIVENLLYLISNTGPAIQCKLLEVLVGLTSCPRTVIHVVSAIKTSGAVINLVQFVEVRENDDLRLASIKLLHNLSPFMSEELAEALRGTAGQLGSLVAIISENTPISEEQAAAAGLLAELPERDLSLTREMLGVGAFENIISKLIGIRQGEIKGIRFERNFQEGLVRILARITFAFNNEPRAITFCREYNVASLFIHLLESNGQDKIQMVSAMALENFSLESVYLSKMPNLRPPNNRGSIFSCLSKPPVVTGLCKIHQGICSLRETFCLVEGEAVEKLVALLDHESDKVVEASLAALSSLLEDGLDVENGVWILDKANGIPHILNVLTENRTENLTRRAVWVVERILRVEVIVKDVAEEPNVRATLVDASQNGDFRTQQIAENALRHIDKIPNFSGIFPNMA